MNSCILAVSSTGLDDMTPEAPAVIAASRIARTMTAASVALGIAVVATACTSQRSDAPTASIPPNAIRVAASEYKFEPATLTVKAGEALFAVTNAGTTAHEFEVFQGDKLVDEVEGINPGSTKQLTVTLAPGTYTYVCKLAAHDTLGMKGAITVTAD
jgi:plastocyanin